MKIRTKIIALFILGAVVPLLLSHFFAIRMVSSSMKERIAENMTLLSKQTAGRIADRLENSIEELTRVIEAVPFGNFPVDDLHRVLEIPYRQIEGATAIAILDEKGSALVSPYFKGEEQAGILGRETVTQDDLKLFEENTPFQLALSAKVAIGPVYRSSQGTPRIVMAGAYKREGETLPWVLAAEVSLASICSILKIHSQGESRQCALIDALGRDICGKSNKKSADLDIHPAFNRLESLLDEGVRTYVNDAQKKILEVAEDIGVARWTIVIDEPESTAMAPVERSFYWTCLWVLISIAIAVGGGIILARELTQPIAKLERAAAGIAAGQFEQHIEINSKDELQALANAFNRMADEIKAWNAELKKRVEDRTRALREAEEQILMTQKLAAIGELGSGVAHEINNPLTSVIGVAQLLKGAAEPGTDVYKGLLDIISGARRVADIVDTLLKFSKTQVPPQMHPLDAGKIMSEVLDAFSSRFEKRGIVALRKFEHRCMVFGTQNDLRLAFNHVVDNAMRAAGEGGHIEASVQRIEGGAVLVSIADDGPGIPNEIRDRVFDPFYTTSNSGSSARGLGLPLVFNIVKEHGGRIVIDSKEDGGTKVNIYLSGAAKLSRDQ